MLNFNIRQEGGIGVLTLHGDLTVDRADELKTALMSALEMSDHVLINLSNTNGVDAVCFRLFCSAYEACVVLKKRMYLFYKKPAIVKQMLESGVLPCHSGCSPDTLRDCLWEV